MMKYTDAFSTRQTPQSQPIPGTNQVRNSAGGFTFALDDWGRLDRFLILGSDSPTYYASAEKLTVQNAECVLRCLKADGRRTVDRIVEVSKDGRAPKNDAALFALALASSPECSGLASLYALESLPLVARTGAHLFKYVDYVEHFRGWGRSFREAVADWYLRKSPAHLAYQVVKYQQREGWSHRDLLRLSHPKPPEQIYNDIFAWAVSGTLPGDAPPSDMAPIVGYELAKRAQTTSQIVKYIRDYKLTREMVPNTWLHDADVWAALLEEMPMTAMIRNLANMTRAGLLAPMSAAASLVAMRLDSEAVLRAKVHPLTVLVALNTYKGGVGVARGRAVGYHTRGKVSNSDVKTWTPVPRIVDALDDAFYQAFGNVENTGQRWMLALDVSSSMTCGEIAGMTGVTPRVGSAAMALITARVEPNHMFVGFTSGGGRWTRGHDDALSVLDISPRQRLDDVVRTVDNLPFGGTDCALPMIHALENRIPIDTFVIYTDHETWAGNIHPTQALKEYRRKMGIPAKLVVVGMTSTGFSIADPNDGGMLDVVGMDLATPNLISQFALGF